MKTISQRIRRSQAGLLGALAVAAGLMLLVLQADPAQSQTRSGKREPMLAHMVFFTLKDQTPEARQKLVAACDKYLTDHPGTEYYSAGVRAADLTRPVNDQEFDVALHVVFKDRESHDAYQTAPRHLQFIEENKETWAKVRVFDSYVGAEAAGK